MKILCVIDSLGSGGAQRQLVNLAISFKEKGHDIFFLVYHRSPFYYDLLQDKGIEVIEVIEPSYLKRIFRMRKVIRNGGYDSVLSFLEAPNFICELASFPARKWRLVVGERSADPRIYTSLRLRMYRFFHLFADAVVANSYENIKMVRKINPFLPGPKCHVIYNMVDFKKWTPIPENYQFRSGGKLKLVVAARHHYLKNLNCLVEAINLLEEAERSQILVEWYGRADDDDSYLRAMDKIKKYYFTNIFHFYPPVIDINKKINSADVVGLFSFYEGLPNTVCEAMANSKVVIASDISDINRLLNNKFIFDPKSHIELSFVLKMLLNMRVQDFSTMGELNRRNALQLFDEGLIANKYLDLLS